MAVTYYIDPVTKEKKIMSIQGFADPNVTYSKDALDKKVNTKSTRDVSVSVNTDYLGMVRTDGPLHTDRPQSVNYNIDLSQSSKDKINNAMTKTTSSEQYSTEFKESSAEYKFNNGATNQNATLSPIGVTARGSSPSGGADTEYKANEIHNVKSSMSGSSDVTLKFPSKSGTYTFATTEDVDNVDSKVDTLNEALTDEKMLGWTVPEQMTVRNSVSGNQFIQKVAREDIKKLEINYVSDAKYFFIKLNGLIKRTASAVEIANIYLEGYNTTSQGSWNYNDKNICYFYTSSSDTSSYILIKNTECTNAEQLKATIKGYIYYEPAVPVVKQIDGNEAVEQVKQSLDVYGLVDKYDGLLQQGGYLADGTYQSSYDRVSSVTKYPCVAGKTVRLHCDNATNYHIAFFNGNTFVSRVIGDADGVFVVPSDANCFIAIFVNISGSNITPSTAKNIHVFTNNAIDTLKAELEPIEIALSDYAEVYSNAITVEDSKIYKSGNVIDLCLKFTVKAEAPFSDLAIIKLKKYKPKDITRGGILIPVSKYSTPYSIDTNIGAYCMNESIQIASSSLTSNKIYYIHFTYITD